MKDYNFGSLIRTDARFEYGEKNTIFGQLQSLTDISILTTLFFSHTNTGMS